MTDAIQPATAGEFLAALPEGALLPVLAQPSDRNPAAVYLAGLAAGSRRSQLHALNAVAGLLSGGHCTAETLPWAQLRYQHVAAVRSHLAGAYAVATANRMLCALRGVLRECFHLGQMEAENYQKCRSVKSIRGTAEPAGRSLTRRELQRLFETCAKDRTPSGARDAALLAVLYGAGLRRAEVVGLEVGDYQRETKALMVRRGKGNKARTSYIGPGGEKAVAAWLKVRGTEPGPLFVPIRKGGRLEVRALTDQALYETLQKRATQAGLASFSPHDLRRTFVGDLLDAGADISAVQKLAGHSSVNTTARYDRRGERAKQQASELLAVPYVAG